ncbi:AAA family ATPase [Luteimonas suaedae]|uniref:AAA family ATPase n=1 Tax=Luteimonas suaedae TaxID=2605430 RepID=UPI0011EBFBCA
MNQKTAPIRIAVTGGPGAGKTALLEGLRGRGYPVVSEVAREVIAGRKARGLSPRPPPAEFARTVLDRDVQQYDCAPADDVPTFFDRCVLDSMSMLAQLDQLHPRDKSELLAQYPYYPTAFILPPWREIYCTDTERDQDSDEAVSVHHALRDWYIGCGYNLVEGPGRRLMSAANSCCRRLSERRNDDVLGV